MLRNFDDVEVSAGVTCRTTTRAVPPGRFDERTGVDRIGKADEDWTPQDLRNYVVTEIEKRFGRWERNPITEMSIFKSFMKRWGTDAVRMARYLFETCDGWWEGKPATVNRFCKGSDPYFATPLSTRLPR